MGHTRRSARHVAPSPEQPGPARRGPAGAIPPGVPSSNRDRWSDLGGPVHWLDHGGPAGGTLVVGVHGLGGSGLDWNAVAPLLTRTCRLVAPDLLGFGRTRSAGRPVSVRANRVLLHRFVTEILQEPAVLVGNSMGGMIAAYQAAAEPATVRGLVLVNPALPPPWRTLPDPQVAAIFGLYSLPVLGPLAVRGARRARTPGQSVEDMLRLCVADPEALTVEALAEHVALARLRRDFPEASGQQVTAARSLMAELARRRRYARTLAAIERPVLLLHGARDRLVHIVAARAVATANPGWRFEVIGGAGHVPMLEAPEWTAATILDWLDGLRLP